MGSDDLQGRLVLGGRGAGRDSELGRSHVGTHPRLARALVLGPGLALPLAGCVACANHPPSLATISSSGRQLHLFRESEVGGGSLC